MIFIYSYFTIVGYITNSQLPIYPRGLILLSVRAFETNSETEFCLARANVYIFSCFVTFLSSLLLIAAKPTENNPKTVATPASAGLATIPKPVKAVARVADDSPAESEPRPTAEMCVIECVLFYFFATFLLVRLLVCQYCCYIVGICAKEGSKASRKCKGNSENFCSRQHFCFYSVCD